MKNKSLFLILLFFILNKAHADNKPDYLREATGLAGAGAGVAIGAEVGSFFGPPGVALGGLIGGVTGGLASYYSYDKLNKKYIYPLQKF